MKQAKNNTCTTKYDMTNIWYNVVEHNFGKKDRSTADARAELLIKLCGVSDVRELDKDPSIIDEMKSGLFSYIQPNGKNKGQKYSHKTIKECFRLFRQIVRVADENFGLKNTDKILRKLSLRNNCAVKDLNPKKDRIPLNDLDYKVLFSMMAKIKCCNFDDLDTIIKKNSKLKKKLELIKKFPDQHYYAILISLFTGSRANASCTLRHRDIDLKQQLINVHCDKELINNGDIREGYKHLKTEESSRVLPISDLLFLGLGLRDYLIEHEKQYGTDAFIFEEAIKTRNNTYNPSIINSDVNALMEALEIKPEKGSKYIKDFHSLKKCFYSANVKVGIPLEMLEAIAGNKPSNNSIAAKTYAKISMESSPLAMIDAANQITFPYITLLLGKKWVKSKQKQNSNIMIQTNISDKTLKDAISKIIGKKVKGMVVFYV